MINLDHNATTPLHPRVRDAISELLGQGPLGNPSSLHRAGQAARAILERARRRVAAAVDADPLEVTFTSGGTEADALGILGVARALRRTGAPCRVLTSPIEHPAVLGAVGQLRAEGHPVTMVEPDADGRIGTAAVEAALVHADRAKGVGVGVGVGVVALAAANHELGNRYDIAALVQAVRARAPQAHVHVDAVQALGKVAVSRQAWGADTVAVSAHKIGGPPGVGALIHARARTVVPLFGPGHHERGRRPGTESVVLIHGFGVAAEHAEAERVQTTARVALLRAALVQALVDLGGAIHGDPDHHIGNTITVSFAGLDGHLLMIALDLEGVAVSTGAACDAGAAEPSAVLRALGHERAAGASIRISLGRAHTAEDSATLLRALGRVLPRMREARAS